MLAANPAFATIIKDNIIILALDKLKYHRATI